MALQFRYAADQPHQRAAVDAVCDLFRGQEFLSSRFTAAESHAGEQGQLFTPSGEQTSLDIGTPIVGYANGLRLAPEQLLKNLHSVEEGNGLPPTNDLHRGRPRDFTVEMETGTGKTYAYTRTIYELNKRYALTKFVIVVPSVAVREGVKKSLDSTYAHFQELYDGAPMSYFVYDSKDMGPVANFALSSSIQVMVINIGAFNKDLQDDGSPKAANLFYRPAEKLPEGVSPQELVSQCQPIVIIDEPQSVDNTDKARKAIESLNPLFVLRYSATHKQRLNTVYELGPVEAFQEHLVKGIVVDSVASKEDLNGGYVRLDIVESKPGKTGKTAIKASVTLDQRQTNGTQKRKKLKVKVGDDLYLVSKENEDYQGWQVSNIGTNPGAEFIEFTNGIYLERGEAVGDVADESVKLAQIKRTIEDHLEQQLRLWPLGVKVLSLFFIDKVARYRTYDADGRPQKGDYAKAFERLYCEVAGSERWRRAYEKAGVPLPLDPGPLHQGYFSVDGKGRFKDSKVGADTKDDTSAFALIMRKKETLVSLPDGKDPDKDVAFIFSHSALKEGWDNPNVFQICTLVETQDTLTKRQKIGRGLRLCVNQQGERVHDLEVNRLTVIASESYDAFARGLQTEFERTGLRFGTLRPESFTQLVVTDAHGNENPAGFETSKAIYEGLADAGLVDDKGTIKPELKELAETGDVPLPEGLEELQAQVCDVVLHRAQKLQVRDKRKEVAVRLNKDVTADPAFMELWERIRQTTRFELNVDVDRLVAEAVDGVRHMEKVKPVEVVSTRADLDVDVSGVVADEETVRTSVVNTGTVRAYDLPDPLAELQDRVGLTRATIKRILEGSGRMGEFSVDPMTFLSRVASKIQTAKDKVVAAGIKYTKLPESEWYTMNLLAVDDLKGYLDQNAWKPSNGRSVYDYVIYDSSTVELGYAKELDQSEDVKVFAKLPPAFKIQTPLGSYNPDWAYVEEKEGKQRVFFVVETKGKPRGENRPTEEAKINCAERHFEALNLGEDFAYEVRTTLH